jgi:hypothetical protein
MSRYGQNPLPPESVAVWSSLPMSVPMQHKAVSLREPMRRRESLRKPTALRYSQFKFAPSNGNLANHMP